jgi:hypothetical protein
MKIVGEFKGAWNGFVRHSTSLRTTGQSVITFAKPCICFTINSTMDRFPGKVRFEIEYG